MLKQTIRRADIQNEDGVIIPRFGPLVNDSQIKNEYGDIEKYRRCFLTLKEMNNSDWKLESFASILDANLIRMQVAIFSKIEN